MNCDPWVSPTFIYTQSAKNELEARKKWTNVHGGILGYDMSKPPTHRQNSFMSWMCDMPDHYIELAERQKGEDARKNCGVKEAPKRRKNRQLRAEASEGGGVGTMNTDEAEAQVRAMLKDAKTTVSSGSKENEKAKYKHALRGMKQELLHALQQVDGEMGQIEASASRPITGASRRSTHRGPSIRPRSAAAPVQQYPTAPGRQALQSGGGSRRPLTAVPASQRSRHSRASGGSRDLYKAKGDDADFERRFEAALQPARQLMTKRRSATARAQH